LGIAVGLPVTQQPPPRSRRAVFPHRALRRYSPPQEVLARDWFGQRHNPWPGEREWQREFRASIQRPIASIVIATSKPDKDWFPERWAEVADALHEKFGMQVVLVGGNSERELAAERIVMDKARHKPRSELGSGLRNLVSILDASALVLSPDTGPLHIAVALGRPVISLIGYTNPKRTGPYRRFQDLIVDAYGDPGENYPISMENRLGRMKRIETKDVLAKVAVWKERYAGKTGQ